MAPSNKSSASGKWVRPFNEAVLSNTKYYSDNPLFMQRVFTERLALNIMLVIFSGTIIFHLLVLAGIVPYDMVWGGRLKDGAQMRQFEIISILMNGVMLMLVLFKAGIILNNIPYWVFLVGFWAMAVLFLMNTVGNILSNNAMEKAIFTPITIVLFFCSLRLALSSKKNNLTVPTTQSNI